MTITESSLHESREPRLKSSVWNKNQYSNNSAHSDFHLFRGLDHFICDKEYDSFDAIKLSLSVRYVYFLAFLKAAIMKLSERRQYFRYKHNIRYR